MTEPIEFVCPISKEIMRDPVFCSDGNVYDRAHITKWLKISETSPITTERMYATDMVEHKPLRRRIKKWCADAGLEMAEPLTQEVKPTTSAEAFTLREHYKMYEIVRVLPYTNVRFKRIPNGIVSERLAFREEATIRLEEIGCRVLYIDANMRRVSYVWDDRMLCMKLLDRVPPIFVIGIFWLMLMWVQFQLRSLGDVCFIK